MSSGRGGGWTRFDVSDWELAGEEPQGLQPHPWLSTSTRERPWLFKAARPNTDRPLSEDVVEKIASEVAAALGVPAASVDLVTRATTSGCIVETLRPSRWVMQAGQVLLGGIVNDYDPGDRGHRGYNLRNVRRALSGFGPPPNSPATAALEAFDVFAGYLLFDALIANTDRHDRNWAVLLPPPGVAGPDTICGSYDHGSSLGFNLSDEQRHRVLTGRRINDWALRATARQFEHTPSASRRSLVDLAGEGIGLCGPAARQHWHGAFQSVTDDQLVDIVDRAPQLTDITRRFTIELLQTNRERVLDVLS